MTVFTLHTLVGGNEGDVRGSRIQFFDLMGSERFKGGNAAHNSAESSKSTMGGWEGIFANFSLMGLTESVRAAATMRRKAKKGKGKGKGKPLRTMIGSVLTNMLKGSLEGNAVTSMVTCLSQHPRWESKS
jgi:DnaJ-class molecular chaperone